MFRKNCYGNKQQRIEFNLSAYIITKERGERERKERQRARREWRREVSMLHRETCLLIAEADRVLCHLIMF